MNSLAPFLPRPVEPPNDARFTALGAPNRWNALLADKIDAGAANGILTLAAKPGGADLGAADGSLGGLIPPKTFRAVAGSAACAARQCGKAGSHLRAVPLCFRRRAVPALKPAGIGRADCRADRRNAALYQRCRRRPRRSRLCAGRAGLARAMAVAEGRCRKSLATRIDGAKRRPALGRRCGERRYSSVRADRRLSRHHRRHRPAGSDGCGPRWRDLDRPPRRDRRPPDRARRQHH